jgi:hypothetical protein
MSQPAREPAREPARVPRPYVGAAERAPRGVVGGQFCAALAGDEVVVFLIGMRINRLHRVWSWWPVFRSMQRMLGELAGRPDAGLLGARSYWSGRVLLTIQYWRSVEHLGAYARDAGLAHAPMWSRFNRRTAATADVGIFHETYAVRAEQVESLYGNMPRFGLAAAEQWVPRSARARSTAGRRMGQQEPEYALASPAARPAGPVPGAGLR